MQQVVLGGRSCNQPHGSKLPNVGSEQDGSALLGPSSTPSGGAILDQNNGPGETFWSAGCRTESSWGKLVADWSEQASLTDGSQPLVGLSHKNACRVWRIRLS